MIHHLGTKENLNLFFKIHQKVFQRPLGVFEIIRSFRSVDNLLFVVQLLINKNIESDIFQVAISLPIITTNAVGCRDCVDEGINCFLVPIGDPNILAEKMIVLIENPAMINEMGKASRIKAENEFSLAMVIEKTFEIYEKTN